MYLKFEIYSKLKYHRCLLQISVLSTVNHKNFMNLLGYCEEDEPFTRMVVFEYASNGTLFEHLHSEFLTLSSNLHHFSVYEFLS